MFKLLGDKNTLIYAAALAIIRSARKYQNLTIPLNDLPTLDLVLTSVLYKSGNNTEPELMKMANIIYDELYEILERKNNSQFVNSFNESQPLESATKVQKPAGP